MPLADGKNPSLPALGLRQRLLFLQQTRLARVARSLSLPYSVQFSDCHWLPAIKGIRGRLIPCGIYCRADSERHIRLGEWLPSPVASRLRWWPWVPKTSHRRASGCQIPCWRFSRLDAQSLHTYNRRRGPLLCEGKVREKKNQLADARGSRWSHSWRSPSSSPPPPIGPCSPEGTEPTPLCLSQSPASNPGRRGFAIGMRWWLTGDILHTDCLAGRNHVFKASQTWFIAPRRMNDSESREPNTRHGSATLVDSDKTRSSALGALHST